MRQNPAVMEHTSPLALERSTLRRFGQRGMRVLLIGSLICWLAAMLFAKNFWPGFIYGLCITMGCWFFIDGGRMVVASWLHRRAQARGIAALSSQWPGWAWMASIIVAGTLLGYTMGYALARWVTGFHAPSILDYGVSQGLAVLLASLVPGIVATYFFYSRERLAHSEALAQTAQRQAAENQLRLLESQLEPHMLFNTLANLRVLIGVDPPRAQAMLDRLIAFLRATLEASRSGSHSLATEFARIADYLELMQIRMGERLHSQFDLPPELAGAPVPPLLLQPLVENAIKHGLEPHVGGGRLIVSASREGDHLMLRVRDTGAGLSDGAGDGTHFGLAQVRERLATLYGQAASLTLAPATDGDGGAVAVVRLPLPALTTPLSHTA